MTEPMILTIMLRPGPYISRVLERPSQLSGRWCPRLFTMIGSHPLDRRFRWTLASHNISQACKLAPPIVASDRSMKHLLTNQANLHVSKSQIPCHTAVFASNCGQYVTNKIFSRRSLRMATSLQARQPCSSMLFDEVFSNISFSGCDYSGPFERNR
jgi:hypothetical protein